MGTISRSLHENVLETCQSVHLRGRCTCCDGEVGERRDFLHVVKFCSILIKDELSEHCIIESLLFHR